jgi:hypothetical protein
MKSAKIQYPLTPFVLNRFIKNVGEDLILCSAISNVRAALSNQFQKKEAALTDSF